MLHGRQRLVRRCGVLVTVVATALAACERNRGDRSGPGVAAVEAPSSGTQPAAAGTSVPAARPRPGRHTLEIELPAGSTLVTDEARARTSARLTVFLEPRSEPVATPYAEALVLAGGTSLGVHRGAEQPGFELPVHDTELRRVVVGGARVLVHAVPGKRFLISNTGAADRAYLAVLGTTAARDHRPTRVRVRGPLPGPITVSRAGDGDDLSDIGDVEIQASDLAAGEVSRWVAVDVPRFEHHGMVAVTAAGQTVELAIEPGARWEIAAATDGGLDGTVLEPGSWEALEN